MWDEIKTFEVFFQTVIAKTFQLLLLYKKAINYLSDKITRITIPVLFSNVF